MKAIAALAVLVGAGLVAGTATGDPIPIPPVPTVTVSLPPPPVPLPVAPALPEPVVTTTATAPASSTLSQASQVTGSTGSTLSGGSLIGSSSSSSSSSPSSGSSSSSSSSSSFGPGGTTRGSAGPERVNHFQSSRPWIGTTGPKKRRTTTFTFVLPSPARVIFTVKQVSPTCVGIGNFGVAGHAGLNRVRFAGRVHGRQLAPGTYRIAARTTAGRLVRRITLVVVSGSAPTPAELTALRAANACGAAAGQTGTGGTSAARLPEPQLPKPLTEPDERAAGIAPQAPNLHTGVLGSAVAKTARAIQPLLVALLALAIVLLAVASLPRVAVPDPRVHDLLAKHRIEIAALGAAALVGVALAFLLA
jgi:hypothetical protein